MEHLALFNGIGGFQLAADWIGWKNVASVEIDSFCNKVTKYHFPNTIQHEDIKTTDFSIYRGRIDIITGGFPCQPYSVAGQRKGKDDELHLWPEMLRAIREIAPNWVVGENVRGLINWNGGMVFDEVQADLETAGYEVLPFLLPAASVNASHKRDRVWFIAYASSQRCNNGSDNRQKRHFQDHQKRNTSKSNTKRYGRKYRFSQICKNEFITNTSGFRQSCKKYRKKKSKQPTQNDTGKWFDAFPTQPPICDGNDGLPSQLDGITFSKWRNESIKAGGNAIVPQVALQIFKAIEEYAIINK
ncbi:MAG: hypothetical protein BM557_02030 [Flavobacterium sp. MedPE-SWcel]|uniref:DNA cytosine methyltransferase n=1 Tax=uncultured Flavobacterium sp. TaxID=165435 RepID=UPI00091AE486|nr:DNA cytosine methyltransferase [uncultured Flavobacterium sp.]OIQ22176.1 MAG: hypothetical protein BM557_02030 [Flavobacterium sp. MedPE-SWcel]